MQKIDKRYHVAAWAILMVVVCLMSTRPANATVFNFAGSCDTLFCPILGFGSAGSSVTGQLDVLDSAVGPGLTFDNSQVVSFSLGFELRDLVYVGPFFNSTTAPGLVGRFNDIGLGIEQISIVDSLGQIFEANLGAEGSFFFTAIDTVGFIATGDPIAFDMPTPVAAPEPGSIAIFLFALGSMYFAARQRRSREPSLSRVVSHSTSKIPNNS